ncbi:s-formylglutathione hydrolase (fgh) (esterase d) [Pseudomonas aeruginosa VRFPA02]|nr:s-formylglutathione hydrolase (fgh) (esterase d) [Pseudomonas aeruginosa VRFPA02]
MQILPVRQDQPLPGRTRHPGQGPDARRHQPFLLQGRAGLPLHGLLDLLRIHRAAGNLPGEDSQGCPAGEGLPAWLRRHHRDRRRAEYRQGGRGRYRCHLRPGRYRPGGDHRGEDGQGRAHHRGRHQPGQVRHRQGAGRHRLHQSEGLRQADPGRHRRTDRWRRRLLLRVRRQRAVDARRAGMLPQGLGRVGDHRCRRRRPGNQHPAVPTGHRPRLARFGVRRGARAQRVAELCREGAEGRDPAGYLHHPHHGAGGHQRGLRADARRQEHPHRHSLLTSRRGGPCGSPRPFHGRSREGFPRTDRQPEDLRRLAPALPSFFPDPELRDGLRHLPAAPGRAGGGAAGPVLAVRADLYRRELHAEGRRPAGRRRTGIGTGGAGYQPARQRCPRRSRRRLGLRPGRRLLPERHAGALGRALPHARLRGARVAGADRGAFPGVPAARHQRALDGWAWRAGLRAAQPGALPVAVGLRADLPSERLSLGPEGVLPLPGRGPGGLARVGCLCVARGCVRTLADPGRPGRARRLPRRPAQAGSATQCGGQGRPPAGAASATRLRPQLLLHRQFHRGSPAPSCRGSQRLIRDT